MDTKTNIFRNLVVLYFICIISLIQYSSCYHENGKTKKEKQIENGNCDSSKLELLVRDLLKKSFLFPRITSVEEKYENDTVFYYLRLINFAVPKKNFYIHLSPSDSDEIDSIKLVLTDTIITKGREVALDISEKNEDTSKVKISVRFGVNKIASGVGLYGFEFISDSCTWNMKDSVFSWEY